MRDQDERIQALEAEKDIAIANALTVLDMKVASDARAEAAESQLTALNDLLEKQSRQIEGKDTLESQLTALRQQLEALRPYMQHMQKCDALRVDWDKPTADGYDCGDCDCGLDALLIALSAHVG